MEIVRPRIVIEKREEPEPVKVVLVEVTREEPKPVILKLEKSKRPPGRPRLAEGEGRVPVTIRLPPDLAKWLRKQRNYSRLIEKLLRAEFARDARHKKI